MASFIIIGGGISGLTSAYYLSKSSVVGRIILLESTSYLGGWMRSQREGDGSVFETGPRSIRGAGISGSNTLQLLEELKMENEILPISRGHPAASKRFIYANGRLNALPSGLVSTLRPSEPFSKSFAHYLLSEPFKSCGVSSDESISSFFSRRFGEEVALYAADPLCRGVFAGDSKSLEMKSCFPAFYDLEKNYGSLVLGALRKPKAPSANESSLVKRMKSEKWSIWSLKRGLGSLPENLVAHLNQKGNVEIMTNMACSEICFNKEKSSKMTVVGQDGTRKELEADHVICALPSTGAGALIKTTHPDLADLLYSISSASVAVVSVQYDQRIIPVQGFGHLIPSTVIPGVLGVIYESAVFPQHDGDTGGSRYTVMMGGAWFNETFGDMDSCDIEAVSRLAVESISNQLGIKHQPMRIVANILKNCIPQYLCGHSRTLTKISDYLSRRDLPLSLIGSSYRGVSVNDCIYNTKLEVESLVQKLLH